MHNNELKDWQPFIELILQLLNKREIKVKKVSFQLYF